MKIPRRKFLHLAAGAAALPLAPYVAQAQAYPSRPVRIVVGFAPGGATDLFARLIAQWFSEQLGQQFVVENKPGAGGNLATETVMRAAPDGYTLHLASATDSYNAALYDNLKFDFVRDLAPVASISRGAGILVVHPAFMSKTVPELIAYARSNPGKITVASSGIGSPPHVYCELFKGLTKLDMLHIPYRRGNPALTDLLGGQVQVMFATLASSIEYVRSGQLRPLAVTSRTRLEILPEIPTVNEFVPNYEAIGWIGIVAPKRTPAEVVQKLNQEITAGLVNPKIKERIADLGSDVFANSAGEFGKFIAEYTEKWGQVIRAANIKPG